MLGLRQCVIAVGVSVFGTTILYAGKVPLSPEQLLEESKLIIVAQVQSHRDTERTHLDGSKIRDVFLKVRVESVAKGENAVKRGDDIEVVCWTVVKAPPQGEVWDSGNYNIPGEGGRARFFLEGSTADAWPVIYPNGIERLDETPVLSYPFEPAEQAQSATAETKPIEENGGVLLLVIIAVSAIALVIVAAVLGLVRAKQSRMTKANTITGNSNPEGKSHL